jgi:hypothetical protein
MTRGEINLLAQSDTLPGGVATVVETHMSWVLMNDTYVFKIKKPVLLSFVDYRLRAQRRYYCTRELMLNRRYAQDVYLDVLAVGRKGSQWVLGSSTEVIEDYALYMRRLDNNRQLDYLLQHRLLRPETNEITRIAQALAAFHRKAEMVAQPLDPVRLLLDFNDIENAQLELMAMLGADAVVWIKECSVVLPGLLGGWKSLLEKRAAQGWRVDGHGDLHAANIFIYPDRVIFFDAVEFNDSWRRVDVLDELAFLSVDLDFFDQPNLKRQLWNAYEQAYASQSRKSPFHESLLLYFQLYRANVRLKVTALLWRQLIADGKGAFFSREGYNREEALLKAQLKAKRYFDLMQQYANELKITTALRLSTTYEH